MICLKAVTRLLSEVSSLGEKGGGSNYKHHSCPPSSPSLKTHHSKRLGKLSAALANDTPTSPLFSGGVINLKKYDQTRKNQKG